MAVAVDSTTETVSPPEAAPAREWLPWLVLIVVLAANIALRWPLLGMPLERDEGEFAYGGQLLLSGEAPYRSLYAMKWPGIYAAYAVVELLFGRTTVGIHQGLILATTINIVWMYWIGRRIVDAWGGAWAAGAFAALCYSPAVEPMSTQSQHFVLMFALPGILAMASAWHAPRWRVWLLAGLCLGVGALMKQHGAFLGLAGLAGIAWRFSQEPPTRLRWLAAGASYLLGLVLPLAITCVLLKWAGTFDTFWLWTVEYARAYATGDPLAVGLGRLSRALGVQVPPVWPLLLVAVWGMVVAVKHRRTSDFGLLLAAWTVASVIAILPGWHFRPHYFFLLWPPVAILAAIGLRSLAMVRADNPLAAVRFPEWHVMGGWMVALAIVLWPVTTSANYLLTKSHWELSRATYGIDPFNECPTVAEYLARHTTPNDTIAVLGSQPQLYFQSQRRAATGHMYAYPLMEAHPYAERMQQSMIEEIRTARPKYVVLVQDWTYKPGVPTLILDWLSTYIDRHYELDGCVEILSPSETRFVWGPEALSYQPRKFCIIQVFRRRGVQPPGDGAET